jgi:hypothetical protein
MSPVIAARNRRFRRTGEGRHRRPQGANRAGEQAMDVGERPQRRDTPRRTRRRADARGGDGCVREELAMAIGLGKRVVFQLRPLGQSIWSQNIPRRARRAALRRQ